MQNFFKFIKDKFHKTRLTICKSKPKISVVDVNVCQPGFSSFVNHYSTEEVVSQIYNVEEACQEPAPPLPLRQNRLEEYSFNEDSSISNTSNDTSPPPVPMKSSTHTQEYIEIADFMQYVII